MVLVSTTNVWIELQIQIKIAFIQVVSGIPLQLQKKLGSIRYIVKKIFLDHWVKTFWVVLAKGTCQAKCMKQYHLVQSKNNLYKQYHLVKSKLFSTSVGVYLGCHYSHLTYSSTSEGKPSLIAFQKTFSGSSSSS